MDFYSAISLQQPADRHVTPLGHIILLPSQPIVLSVLLQFMDTFLALVTFYQYLNNRMEISVTFWNTWFRHLEGIAIIFLKILHRWLLAEKQHIPIL
jgi:hypothetical protein